MKEIVSFFADDPVVCSVKVEPLFVTSQALGPLASLTVQMYELDDVKTAEPVSVTVVGPFVFGIVNVPLTTCCDIRSVPVVV